MSVRIGVNPIAWSNDDMQELGGETPLETCLTQGKAIGFAGFELGHKFPRQSKVLGPILKGHGLDLVSGWYSTNLLERSVEAEIEAVQGHLTLLRDLGAKVMVVAETSGCVHGNRAAPLSWRRRIEASEWPEFSRKMTAFSDYLRDQGVPCAYHHHMGTVVETPAEIDQFMETTGESVGLLLDTGHATFAGGDPLKILDRWAPRIRHVHCKDVRPDVLKSVKAANASFLDAVIQGVFTVPSDGCVDFKSVLSGLKQYGYKGDWLVIEAEQDPAKADPVLYLTKGYKHLQDLVSSLGL